MSTEISLHEKIEAARARLKTAYDVFANTGRDPIIRQNRYNKWQERKRELQALLDQQKQTAPIIDDSNSIITSAYKTTEL